jgi:tetratricopeptide (TPR) repeat protein
MLALEECIGGRDVVVVSEPEAGELPSGSRGLQEATAGAAAAARDESAAQDPIALAIAALRADTATERLRLLIEAVDRARTAPLLLARASACMEVNDLDSALRDLEAAREMAPKWGAVHFERGKLWLRRDDMDEACAAFRRAAELMPRLGSAWSNLGATLGELDRPEEALQAFTRALACDPDSAQTHNNIGVLERERGRLREAEAAFRRVIDLAPDLAFGYYNLGHTLFLEGRYQAALAAYAAGQQRDPDRNPVQASRLAMCRLATGDAAGAIAELQRATAALPRAYRQQLLADAHTIAWALLTHRPDLPGWQQVHAWLTREQGG